MLATIDPNALPQQLANGLLLGAIYALMALGYTMVYGVLRLINFAHGEVFMLGAYIALFISLISGGTTTPIVPQDFLRGLAVALVVLAPILYLLDRGVRKSQGRATPLPGLGAGAVGLALVLGLPAFFQPQAINLVLMLLASMAGCAVIGVIIERAAYRPMRNQPRIASLITAIGVSLLLQFGGQLFLPTEPQPSIAETVNPYRGSVTWVIARPGDTLQAKFDAADDAYKDHDAEFQRALKLPPTDPAAAQIKDRHSELDEARRELQTQVNKATVQVTMPQGQVIMFLTVIALMLGLRHLVLFTKSGRAMRAVAHDMDSASLMGVSVNKVVTYTFILGSALAGAGAMMNATFLGTPLDTFYGLQPGVKAFVAAVLGGIGNIPGAALGGLLMGVAETLVVAAGYSELKDAVAFVVLIAVLMFRPGGLLGSSKVEKV